MHLRISCGSCSQGAHSIGKQESNKYLQFIMSNALGKVTQSTMGKYGRPPNPILGRCEGGDGRAKTFWRK